MTDQPKPLKAAARPAIRKPSPLHHLQMRTASAGLCTSKSRGSRSPSSQQEERRRNHLSDIAVGGGERNNTLKINHLQQRHKNAQHALLRTMRDMTNWFCDASPNLAKKAASKTPINAYVDRSPRAPRCRPEIRRRIQEIVLTTKTTPRECLGFRIAFQALIAELGKDVQIRFS